MKVAKFSRIVSKPMKCCGVRMESMRAYDVGTIPLRQKGIPPNKLRLVFVDKRLEDSHTLSDSNI